MHEIIEIHPDQVDSDFNCLRKNYLNYLTLSLFNKLALTIFSNCFKKMYTGYDNFFIS